MKGEVEFQAVLECDKAEPCRRIAAVIEAARHQQADDAVVNLLGLDEVLAKVVVGVEERFVHARLQLPLDQALRLVRRTMVLRQLSRSAGSPPVVESPASATAPPASSVAPTATAAVGAAPGAGK